MSIRTKQCNRLFPGARSHGQQMGEGIYETEVQRIVRNKLRNELENGKELENTTIKFLLSTMKPLNAGWLIDCYSHLTSSQGNIVCTPPPSFLGGIEAPTKF